MTATPIQLGNSDLFVLLNTLRPDLIIDRESFEHMAAPNPFINRAVTAMRTGEAAWDAKALQYLDQAASTSWGQAILRHNPNFVRTCSRLLEGNLSHVERIRMISDTENMHTFSGIINRTRRRDIGSFTIRKPETIVVPFTPEQQQLHNELLRIQADILSRLHGQTSVKFMMTTIRRQAASCLFGLAPLLEGILNRHIDELFFEEIEDEATLPEEREITSMHVQVQELIKMAKSLGPYDPKLEALHHIIRDKQMLPNNKVMLFSSFRHTLSYLNNKLISAGHRVGMVHGGTPDEERNELRARFQNSRENPDCIDILLFSEVGCEGLDYQFCDCIVNYDLPWNPMRVEQRIGRIDRNGQRSESIAIVNLITPGTVDADIYERCLLRIGVFNSALGGSEEILGEITKEIRSIAESYDLSENERKYKLQQLADNKVRLIQEEEELEQRQVELFGIHVPESRMNKEIEDAASFWLSAASIQRLVALYLRRLCGREQEFFLGEKKLKTLRLSQEGRNSLLQDFQALPRQNNSVYREWENWLRGGNPHMLITFECDCAAAHKEAAFITPLHPLVKQAAISLDCGQYILTNLSLKNHDIPTGRHDFAIYQWRFQGVREDLTFQMVASSEALSKKLANLLEAAVDCTENTPAEISATVREKLDAEHYNIWNDAREKHRQHTRELVEFRRESLSTSHRARMALLMEQLAEASNEKIKKMRCSQIATAEADYARRLQDLDIAAERADILAETVAYGVINVIGGESIGG